jgi:hypothetical protein
MPTRTLIDRAFVRRVVSRLRTSARSSTKSVEDDVKALDAAQYDQSLAQPAQREELVAIPERFDDVPEFDFDKWNRRHR